VVKQTEFNLYRTLLSKHWEIKDYGKIDWHEMKSYESHLRLLSEGKKFCYSELTIRMSETPTTFHKLESKEFCQWSMSTNLN